MRAALAVAVVLLVAACGGTKTITVLQTTTVVRTVTTTTPASTTTPSSASACAGNQLTGTFAVIRGSAGAGQVSYKLTLTNTSGTPCFVSGLPQVQLLGTSGSALPTSVRAAQPGTGTAARIVLDHGASATADARFSPDVNGQGDSTTPGPCQPIATVLRVTAPGGGTLDAPVQPPTSVCERGSLGFTLYSAASP
jgi:Protein of unknown function (DUF4232)